MFFKYLGSHSFVVLPLISFTPQICIDLGYNHAIKFQLRDAIADEMFKRFEENDVRFESMLIVDVEHPKISSDYKDAAFVVYCKTKEIASEILLSSDFGLIGYEDISLSNNEV